MHRPGAVARKLPEHAGHHFGRRSHGFRGHPPGLRVPVRKCRLRRSRRKERLRVHRPASRHHSPDGRQGQRQARHDRSRRAGGAGFRGRVARRSAGNHPHCARSRLSGHHQGGRRRRWPWHARGVHRGRALERCHHDALGSRRRVQQPGSLYGEVPREPPPCGNPGAGRWRPQRRLAG
ncbi:hypothetical protein D3C78_1383420 [compost metagenome]